MKAFFPIILLSFFLASEVCANDSIRPFAFDIHGCKRHLKAIAKAVKEAGGKAKKNEGSDKSYRVTMNGQITVYTCTRYGLLETEL